MKNFEKIEALKPFQNAIHGWAFCNADMLSARLKAGQKEIKKLPDELKGEAYKTLSVMAFELGKLRSKELNI